jgi:hypothetical protein
MNVNAVHEWAGDLRHVALDHRRSALAVAGAVVMESAGARVHGGGQHEARGKRQ